MQYSNILLDRAETHATITINRPKYLNALNFESLSEIKDALMKCAQDESIKCIVFKGSGERAFVAGADIKELKAKNMVTMLENDGFQDLFNFIDNYDKPTIAVVHGVALGGGCELAMSCDIRIASEDAVFGLPELSLSIIPAAGGTQKLSRLVGVGNALYMILTGKNVTAKEAKEIGLVNEVYPKEEMETSVNKIIGNLANKSSIALKLAKISVKKGVDASSDVGLMLEKVSQALLFTTEDKKEGMEAFIEKRKPNFIGK